MAETRQTAWSARSAPTARPRVVAIMGSGETAPTLARVHRRLLARLGPAPAACMIDTPYGFQENADDITARTLEYFRDTVGASLDVATLRSADEADPLEHDAAVARVRGASFVFAGPGSPTYALRQWTRTAIPAALAEKVASGGVVTFASAAALTLGMVTAPVYEIYKVGEPAHWVDGLDLMSAAGLRVAVVPHYDNAEGGNHDTRYCYMGARRLAAMERQLPQGVFILGVDGHTALVLDLDAGEGEVFGLGSVTVRAAGRSRSWPSGTSFRIETLRETAAALREGIGAAGSHRAGASPGDWAGSAAARESAESGESAGSARSAGSSASAAASSPLAEEVDRLEARASGALDDAEVSTAVRGILRLERSITEWSRDPGRAGDFDHARTVLRGLIVRLGDLATAGARDPREIVAPFVDALLQIRAEARGAGDWALADAIRRRLLDAGIEVHDATASTEWELVAR